jgi:hypothetical protein
MADVTVWNIIPAAAETLVSRKLFACYVNVAPFGANDDPTWEILGVNTGEASLEYDYDSEKVTDVTGSVSDRVKRITRSVSWDPWPVHAGKNDSINYLQQFLLATIASQSFTKLLNVVDCLVIATYAGIQVDDHMEYAGIRYPTSSITFDDFGAGTGEDELNMAITTSLGGTPASVSVTVDVNGKVTVTGNNPIHKSAVSGLSQEGREQAIREAIALNNRLNLRMQEEIYGEPEFR